MSDMIEILSGYLSHDRRRAVALGVSLPDRTHGTALFADISGFTPLTEQLTDMLGPRRGVEELSRHLNTVYSALIAEVEKFAGSVVGFAGDAIICWFDDEQTCAHRAGACAFAMQEAIQAVAEIKLPNANSIRIAVKIALATGPVRRFLVGDPANHLQDILAGETIDRMARAEKLAYKGDVIADGETIARLGLFVQVLDWREDVEQDRFGVISADGKPIPWEKSQPPETFDISSVNPEQLRPWLLPDVFKRVVSGQGEFLTELRPGVTIFVQFFGVDFESQEAGGQLDLFIRRVQNILARYEGNLIDLTTGDKGSYLQVCFGALTAHEDDTRRGVQAALEIQKLPLELDFLHPLQIGIARGTLRAGTYGGRSRRVYGVLGDDVNLAARLMEAAAPGEILSSEQVHFAVDKEFLHEPRGSLLIKGKTDPIPVFMIKGLQQNNIRLLEPDYVLPMVGRTQELETFTGKMRLAEEGAGQMIGIVAEAGMGKSRLAAEMIRLAQHHNFTGLGGACQSSGGNTPYLVWQPIWQGFFELSLTMPVEEQTQQLEKILSRIAPQRLEALPLLGSLLGLPLPENDFTRALDPQFRKLALEALVMDCLKGYFVTLPHQPPEETGQPHHASRLLIVLEDLHWMDPLSRDLLEEIARTIHSLPILLILAYRPLEAHNQSPLELENLPCFTVLPLNEMPAEDLQNLVRARLAYLFPEKGKAHATSVFATLLEQITERAQGNPFYAEELLNYLHDQELDPDDPAALAQIELPNSLHSLILSRIDQLTEREKTTLKVASIIGRLFPVTWLHGYYPALGTLEQVKADLEELRHLDLTPLDTPEPDLTYLFKHIVTQEVTYESLSFEMRARLHELLAHFLEQTNAHTRTSLLDLLAYHYGRSENKAKQIEYFQKAGEAAQTAYANQAALEYYGKLLPLLEPAAQIETFLKRGAVHELMGNWDEAENDYTHALNIATQQNPSAPENAALLARCYQALGVMRRWRGEYDDAMQWLNQAKQLWESLHEPGELTQTLVHLGIIFWRKGEFPAARQQLEESLTLARAHHDLRGMAFAINNLGNVAWRQGDHAAAQTYHEENLALRRQLGGKRGIAIALNNVGAIAHEQGDHARAITFYRESLALAREMGDKQGISLSLDNLGMVAYEQGDHPSARNLFQESLLLAWELGDKPGILSCLSNLGNVALERGDYIEAKHLNEQALEIAREMGDKFSTRMILHNLGHIAFEQADYLTAQNMYQESLDISGEIDDKRGIAHSVLGLAGNAYQLGHPTHACQLLAAAETLRNEINQAWETSQRRIFDQTLTKIKTTLDTATFQEIWNSGTQMSPDEIMSLAKSSA